MPVGLLLAVVAFVDLRAAAALLLEVEPLWLAASMLAAFADRALMAAKWLPLLRVLLPSVSFSDALRSYLLYSFTIAVFPVSGSAELLRALAVGRRHGAVVEVGASIALERLLGVSGIGIVALLCIPVAWLREGTPTSLSILLAGTAAVGLATLALPALVGPLGRVGTRLLDRPGRLRRLAMRGVDAWSVYQDRRHTLLAVAALSALEQLVQVAILALLARALAAEIGWTALLVATPAALMAGRVALVVGGFGVTEGALVGVLALLGVPPEQGLALAVANRLVQLVVALPGALFWIDLTRRRPGVPPVAMSGAQDGSRRPRPS